MKKCLKFIICLLVLGAILSGVGLVLGGRLPQELHLGDLYDSEDWDEDTHATETAESTTAESATAEPDVTEQAVQKIALHLGRGIFHIMDANETEDLEPFTLGGDTDSLEKYEDWYDVDDDGEQTWVVTASSTTDDSEIYVYLPVGLQCRKMEIHLGSGQLDMNYLETDSLELAVGSGRMDLLYIDADHVDAEVGSGALQLHLKGNWTQYGSDSEKNAGQITVNGQDLPDGTQYGEATLDLETKTGRIEILTQEQQ